MYKGAAFKFTFAIEQDYPHKPPKVKCVPKVGVEYASRFFELTETVPS
jgi:ubiquitin-protein ligase